jgi:hypothetical protein
MKPIKASINHVSLNETYSKVRVGKPLSDKFPIQNGLKEGNTLPPLFFNFALKYSVIKSKKIKSVWN